MTKQYGFVWNKYAFLQALNQTNRQQQLPFKSVGRGSFWPTMFRPFTWGLRVKRNNNNKNNALYLSINVFSTKVVVLVAARENPEKQTGCRT